MSKIQCNDYTYKFHNSDSRLLMKKREPTSTSKKENKND